MQKNIKIVRIITGEDIIGDFSQGNGEVVVKKPYIIYPTSAPKPGEAIKFGMFTYIPYAETEEIKFKDDKIITVVEMYLKLWIDTQRDLKDKIIIRVLIQLILKYALKKTILT